MSGHGGEGSGGVGTAMLRSALEVDRSEAVELRRWIEGERTDPGGSVDVRPLEHLDGWVVDADRIAHRSGRFFSVAGFRVDVAGDVTAGWEQPIVRQPEVGILGLVGRIRDGRLEVLVQAKWEPGNVGLVQVSPSLQATVSNYTGVHGGRLPFLVEQFVDGSDGQAPAVFDTPQLEQGAVYREKRNRNVLRLVDPSRELEVPERFRWVGLAALQALVAVPHALHLDARSILGSVPAAVVPAPDGGPGPAGSFLASARAAPDDGEMTLAALLAWLDGVRSGRRVETEVLPLRGLTTWRSVGGRLVGPPDGPFDVVGVRVVAPDREVAGWDQPLIHRPPSETVLVVQSRRGILHVLVHARTEAGTPRGVALAPTLQSGDPIADPEGLELAGIVADGLPVLDVEQSDEGGRFLDSRVRHRVVILDESEDPRIGPWRRWATLRQLRELVSEPDALTMELRSLLAALPLGWRPDDGALWTS